MKVMLHGEDHKNMRAIINTNDMSLRTDLWPFIDDH